MCACVANVGRSHAAEIYFLPYMTYSPYEIDRERERDYDFEFSAAFNNIT